MALYSRYPRNGQPVAVEISIEVSFSLYLSQQNTNPINSSHDLAMLIKPHVYQPIQSSCLC